MCGISGLIHFDANRRVDSFQLDQMRDVLAHRGPDDQGSFIDGNVGLAHRRLSILDTSEAGHQPFLSADNRYAIVFNGEIYNFQEFYPELEAKGVQFRSKSDTEVLLYLYHFYGAAMLPRLNGMFAFAIWDRQSGSLFLARDRMGVKPLSYFVHDHTFYFASEQKAFFAAGIPMSFSEDGILEYIFNRFVTGENSLFSGVKRLLPGHYMVVKPDGSLHFSRWWNLSEAILNYPAIRNPEAWFQETFYDSIRLRMISDVPVGMLLSGGLDSSSVLASLHHQGYTGVETFNIGFSDAQHNESHLAALLARKYNYSFNTRKVEDELLFKLVKEVGWYNGEPLVHLNEPHLLAISQLAKSKVSVLLSGEGADELLGGYVRYKPLRYGWLLPHISTLLSLGLFRNNHRMDKLRRFGTLETAEQRVIYNGSNLFPSDIAEAFGLKRQPENAFRYRIYQEAVNLFPNDEQRQVLYFDQHTYLVSLMDRNDRTTMGAGIECREPFLDYRIVAGLGTLDRSWFFRGKKGKYLLKKVMAPRLPQEILQFKKVGLSVPWEKYLLEQPLFIHELDEMVNSDIFQLPVLNAIDPRNLVKAFRSGNRQVVFQILPLFMFHIWWKEYNNRVREIQTTPKNK